MASSVRWVSRAIVKGSWLMTSPSTSSSPLHHHPHQQANLGEFQKSLVVTQHTWEWSPRHLITYRWLLFCLWSWQDHDYHGTHGYCFHHDHHHPHADHHLGSTPDAPTSSKTPNYRKRWQLLSAGNLYWLNSLSSDKFSFFLNIIIITSLQLWLRTCGLNRNNFKYFLANTRFSLYFWFFELELGFQCSSNSCWNLWRASFSF